MQNWPENPYWRIFSPHAQGFVPEQPEFRVVETDLRRYHSQDARGNAYNRVSVEPQTGDLEDIPATKDGRTPTLPPFGRRQMDRSINVSLFVVLAWITAAAKLQVLWGRFGHIG